MRFNTQSQCRRCFQGHGSDYDKSLFRGLQLGRGYREKRPSSLPFLYQRARRQASAQRIRPSFAFAFASSCETRSSFFVRLRICERRSPRKERKRSNRLEICCSARASRIRNLPITLVRFCLPLHHNNIRFCGAADQLCTVIFAGVFCQFPFCSFCPSATRVSRFVSRDGRRALNTTRRAVCNSTSIIVRDAL